jgi:hypothetical protein
MVVITDAHVVGLEFFGDGAKGVGVPGPIIGGGGVGQAGDDEFLVAENLVKFDGLVEVFGGDSLQSSGHVGAAGNEAIVIEDFSQSGGIVGVRGVSSKFDGVVADVLDAGQGAGHVIGEDITDGIKLDADERLFGRRGGAKHGTSCHKSSGAGGGGADELASGELRHR